MKQRVWKQLIVWGIILSSFLVILTVSGCNQSLKNNKSTPTMGATQAFQTVQALSTSIAENMIKTPTATSTSNLMSNNGVSVTDTTPTPTKEIRFTPTLGCVSISPGEPKIDVTIVDDTVLEPKTSFTKIWRLTNSGSCTWTSDYSIAWFSGDKLGAGDFIPLPEVVGPGEMVDISVDMVAPTGGGVYQSNWMLQDPDGNQFGLGPIGGSPFWVRIIVISRETSTPTAPPPTETPTPTPAIYVYGTNMLLIDDRIDLETNGINPSQGEDLTFKLDLDSQPILEFMGGASGSFFGASEPSVEICQSAVNSTDPILISDQTTGNYYCYQTNLGLPGWMKIISYDSSNLTVAIELLTWSLP